MKNKNEDYFNKAIVATSKAHPDRNMVNQIINALNFYLSLISKKEKNAKDANDIFCKCFTNNDPETNEPVRNNLKDVYGDSVALGLFDYMYIYSMQKLSRLNNENNDNSDLVSALLRYTKIYIDTNKAYKSNSLSSVKDKIYKSPENLSNLVESLMGVMGYYIKDMCNTIKVTNITDTGKNLFNNIDNEDYYILRDNYHGSYKTGNTFIQISSVLGYKNRRKPQQDAVLSTSKDGCSLNVIADGAGGSDRGQIASTIIIKELKKWFDSYDFSHFLNIPSNNYDLIKRATSVISDSLDMKIQEINKKISEEYYGSYSTVVLALVTPGFILFANVGDSTAYVYNDKSKNISQLTTLDSASYGLSYEDARYNPDNNVVTSAIGDLRGKVHFSAIPNEGSYRIVLSSDGITDLINYNNFASLIKNGNTADEFVRKADQYPDVNSYMKSQDNISAIVIDSEEYTKKRRAK